MSGTDLRPAGGAGRILSGAAHVTDMGGTRGRTLFPSPEFAHWPPFETLAEVSSVGAPEPDPHPHALVEVVNYVISGTLLVYDERNHPSEVPAGSVSLLSTVRAQMHDVNPKPGSTAHWLSLILRLPRGTREPAHPYQNAPSTVTSRFPHGVRGRSVVGEPGPVRSLLGLSVVDAQFEGVAQPVLPVGPGRTAVLYTLEGAVRAAGRDLPAGSGLLADEVPSIAVHGEPGSRFVFASLERGT